LLALALLLCTGTAWASAPRWVTGPPYFTGPSGQAVGWYTWRPLYFTDPADLSASVDHAAADALVAAAAGVWNVPTSGMVIAYGGSLNEHVSGDNSYLGSSGPVFPSDVQSSNYAAVQIAVIYDSDGSVTDMLLGNGASSPAECRQYGVTESVDAFDPSGVILHAIVVLNGRCTGPAPQQQLQMQYQLERAFGRVLGLGWSQTNDNVFTRSPQPTLAQAQHWPIMHPIDIVCGPYTYQCLPQPFTLRDDDVSAISGLYPMMVWDRFPTTPPAPGKLWTYVQASQAYGTMSFPTGQGMRGVNVLLHRQQGGSSSPEAFSDVSSVSGFLYQQDSGNPVTGTVTGIAASKGSTDGALEGYYRMSWVPDLDPQGSNNGPMLAALTTESINPLYIGGYSVGPYVAGSVTPSGSAQSRLTNNPLQSYIFGWSPVETDFGPIDAASNCSSNDGVESAPNPVAATGLWTGILCAHGHTAWSSFTARAGRTATLEVTALDESGLATMAKAMPLLGVWAATDATGTPPTIAATPSAFNTVTLGMTATGVPLTQAQGLRFVIADARGDGRPDFAYKARVLYADTVQPALIGLGGGQITIAGIGFRVGNEVLVNGVQAVVTSWTATTIVAAAPPKSAFGSNPAAAVDVAVVDVSTRGSTVMTGALTYANIAPDVMAQVSAPSGTVAVGTPTTTPFAVRVFLADGVTPVVGLPVTFSAATGSAQFGTCASSSCVILTDATGVASAKVTPTAFGAVTVQAAAAGAAQLASFTAMARSVTPARVVEYLAPGATVAWTPQVSVVQDGAQVSGVRVDWAASGGMVLSPASGVTDVSGLAQAAAVVGPLAAGAQANGQACAWTSVCATISAVGVDPSAWRLVVTSGAGQAIAASGTFVPVVLMVTDGNGHPVAGAAVSVHQTVDAAEMPCPAQGRCPIAPVLGASAGSAISDADGLVSVTPMQAADVAEVTNVAVSAGSEGFISLSLTQGP
jgi:hypothetical protein